MEEACHELDLRIASMQLPCDSGVTFENYVGVLHKLFAVKEESEKQSQVVALLEQLSTYLALTLPEGSPALDEVRKETVDQRRLLQDIVNLQVNSLCII